MRKFCVVFVVFIAMAAKLYAQPSQSRVPGSLSSESVANDSRMSSIGESHSMEFIPNLGQLSDKHGNPLPDVDFYSRYRGLTVYFSQSQIHFYFSRIVRKPDNKASRFAPVGIHDPRHDSMFTYRIDLSLIGADPNATLTPEQPLPDHSNYYIPRFPNGLTDVPAYAALLYHNVYPNIDMRVYSTEQGMKYDFVVRPGGDPSRIRMHYEGPDSLIASNGHITIYSPLGTITEANPVSYQSLTAGERSGESSGESSPELRTNVASNYLLSGNDIAFVLGSYDRSQPVVIDPPRLWGTYFGGSSIDYFIGNCVDHSDNIYVAGTCLDAGFGTAGTHQDTLNYLSGYPYDAIFVKFNPAGGRVWSTYYGAGLSEGWGIAIDHSQNVVVNGNTFDDTCIATTGAYQTVLNGNPANKAWDGFVARFDSAGHRYWGTYFGTSDTDIVYDIAADSSNNIIIVGYTSSTTGAASPGAFKTSRTRTATYDYGGFIAKFLSSGTRLWSTYYGDTVSNSLGVCVGAGDSIIVSGTTVCKAGIATAGTYLSTMPNYVAGYVVKFSPSGSRSWGTYVDGNASFYGSALYGVATHSDGSIYTCGYTWTPTGLGTAGAYRSSIPYGTDGSIFEVFNSHGNRTAGTYIGNSYRAEIAFRVAVDGSGNAIVGGWTDDSTHIATAGAFQSSVIDTNVSFLAKFTKNGARKWGTYFAGNGHPGGWDPIYGVSIDHFEHPIISGATGSDSGMATIGSFQPTYGGGSVSYSDGFVEKFCDTLNAPLHFWGDSTMCYGSIDTLQAPPGYAGYQWRRAGVILPGATSSKYGVPIAQAPGAYRYTVDIADARICVSTSDTLNLIIRSLPTISAGPAKAICLNTSVQIGNLTSGGLAPYHYVWLPDSGLTSASIASPVATPKHTTKYVVIVTDSNGCQAQDSVVVTVRPLPQMVTANNVVICQAGSATIGAPASGSGPFTYDWTPATGLSSTSIAQPVAAPANSTTYRVHITDANGCDNWDTINVIVTAPPVVTLVPTGRHQICAGDSIRLYAPAGMLAYLWSDGGKSPSILVRQSGRYTVAVQDINGCSGASDTVTVSVIAKPLPTIAGPDAECPQSTSSYTALSDPNANYTWVLSGGGTIVSGAKTDSVTINWATAGKWIITLHDSSSAGCEKDTSFAVTIGTTLTPSISPAGPITLCTGDSVVLHAQKGFTKYLWSNGSSADSILVAASGSYSVTVNGSGGCTGTSSPVAVTINPNPKPQPKLAATRGIICAGDSLPLSTTQTFASYLWSTGAATQTINVTQAGMYFVIVASSDGCTGISDSINVTVSPMPVASITANGPTTFCGGDSVILSAPSGAAGYVWSNGEITDSIVVRTSADYVVTVTNAFGCSATSLPLRVKAGLQTKPMIVGPAAVCSGSHTSYSVTLISGALYTWVITGGTLASGQGTNTISITWPANGAGSIEITETDTASGCTGTATISVTIDNNLVPSVTASGSLHFCKGDSVVLDAGAGFLTYQWQLNNTAVAGATSEFFTALASGSYTVFVTNNGSCQGTSKPSVIVVNLLPQAPIITPVGTTLTSSASSKYQWNLNGAPLTGETGQTLLSPKAGDYIVLIVDSNGCSNISKPFTYRDSGQTVVAVPLRLQANPSNAVHIPIELLSSQNVVQSGPMHFTASLRFNKTLLAPTGQTPMGTIQGNDMIVTISGTNPLPLGTTTGVLKTLDFIATLGSDTCTDVTIDAFQWADDAVSVSRQGGRFCLTGVCEAGGTLRLIDPNVKLGLSLSHPNPANTSARVEYDIREEGETELYITDLMGHVVKTVLTGTQIPGHYTAEFDLKNLAQGSYIYVLQTPSAKLSHLLQIIR